MQAPCPICDDSGFRIVERPDGSRAAQRCECRTAAKSARLIQQARIPRRFANCVFESFETKIPSPNPSLEKALLRAQNFVRGYPFETDGKGLLLTGSIGTGKTHLAVATLQALVSQKGATGIFYDYRDLLRELRTSYEKKVDIIEDEVLSPVFAADVLVLDEIGATQTGEWARDTIAHIINTRYNDRKTTIVTTNQPNQPSTLAGRTEKDRWAAATQQETLGDRVGDRIFSRLQEMCMIVEMTGTDFRTSVKRASFA